MKKPTIIILIIILLLPCMTSCGYIKLYYPKELTNEYCMQNYCYADPNLNFLSCDINSADGYSNIEGTSFCFKAIKDVPIEEYLVARHNTIFDKNKYYNVVKNRAMGLNNLEILTYEIESIEIFKRTAVPQTDVALRKLGTMCYDEQIALLTDDQTDAFIEHLKTALETKDYEDRGPKEPDLGLVRYQIECYCIRVHFSEYKNLVWDSYISMQNGTYGIGMYLMNPAYLESEEAKLDLRAQIFESPWFNIRIELPEELADLIPES